MFARKSDVKATVRYAAFLDSLSIQFCAVKGVIFSVKLNAYKFLSEPNRRLSLQIKSNNRRDYSWVIIRKKSDVRILCLFIYHDSISIKICFFLQKQKTYNKTIFIFNKQAEQAIYQFRIFTYGITEFSSKFPEYLKQRISDQERIKKETLEYWKR